MWPHQITLRQSIGLSLLVCFCEGLLLFFAAYLDGTLRLGSGNVGLLQHPGIFSILVGDVVLFGLCAHCAQATRKIGLKLPNKRPALVRRYVRTQLMHRAYSRPDYFLRLFAGFAVVGLLALVNQSIKLFDPVQFYGHDTFDSFVHTCSFVANRLNLFISWCFVLPLFFAYLVIHIAAMNRTVKVTDKRGLLTFNVNHPDRSGGYAYFGCANTLYTFGLVMILIEIFLLIYTHDTIALSNIFAMLAAGIAIIAISFYSIWVLQKAIRKIEVQVKSRTSIERSRGGRDLDVHFFAILYQINFSAYNYIAAKSMFVLRVASVVPALLRLWQYSGQSS